MSEAFICKDQHYEIISSIENEKSFTTTQLSTTVPPRMYQSDSVTNTFSFPIGGVPLWFVFESIEFDSNNKPMNSDVVIGTMYALIDTEYSLGYTSDYTSLSGSRYLTQTHFNFTANSSTMSFDINVRAITYLDQGSALSTTVTILMKYKLQS